MAAPFPYEGVAGASTDPAESEALNLYRQYTWVARLLSEMDAEAEIDLKRVMQIVFHCRKFRSWRDELQARIGGTHTAQQILDVIEGVFAAKKCRWATRNAMQQDLLDIYTDAGTLADWIDTNAPEYKDGFSTNVVLADGVMTDVPVKRAKPPALATRIAAFRSRFA